MNSPLKEFDEEEYAKMLWEEGKFDAFMEQKEKVNSLYFLMDEFLQIEYNLKALLSVLAAIKRGCNEEKEEVKYVINVIEHYLKSVETKVHTAISSVDRFIVEDRRKCGSIL